MDQLKTTCNLLKDEKQRALVIELFAQDVQTGLDGAAAEKLQALKRFVEGLWDKYAAPMELLAKQREAITRQLAAAIKKLGYVS